MKQELYKLANALGAPGDTDAEQGAVIDISTTKKYKQDVLAAIRRKKYQEKRKRALAMAACLAVMATATAVFHKEVQAAIEQFRYSLSVVLGKDMSYYSNTVHTSVSNAGYKITLEDAIIAEEELLVSYTIQRENGGKVRQGGSITGKLTVNGKHAAESSGSSGGYLDQEQKIYGCQTTYRIPGVDLSGKNRYKLEFQDNSQNINGKWKIQFEAYGSELFAETKTVKVKAAFQLPGKNKLILDQLSLNELAHRVTFHTAKKWLKQDIELRAVDDQGTKMKFSMKEFVNGKGFFENGYLVEDGEPKRNWIAKDAKKITIKVYIGGISETDGTDGWKQVGDALVLDLQN